MLSSVPSGLTGYNRHRQTLKLRVRVDGAYTDFVIETGAESSK